MSDTSFRIEEGDFSSPFFLSDTPHYPYLLPEGWEWCRLNEIAESSLGKTLDKSRNTGKVYPYLCAINVKWNDFDLSVVKTIRLEDNEKERYQVLKGDLLICEGGDVGRSAIWDSDEPIYYQNALHRVRFFGNIVANFYLYLIWCYKNHNWIDDICNGVTIKHFTQDKINALYFPLPPVAEQQRIVAEIKRWFSLIDIIETGKDDLQTTIKQAKSKILDLAIHGKLVPQDPNDEPAIELLKRINPDFTPCDNGHYPQLPGGWCYAAIKEAFIINPKNKADDDIEVGFVPMANITDGYNNTFKYETKRWGKIKTGFTHFANGDIAVAKISPCLENRKSVVLKGLPNGIGAGTTELHVFRPLFLDVQYGLYFFKSDYFISQCIGF